LRMGETHVYAAGSTRERKLSYSFLCRSFSMQILLDYI
jgi:hypothetical protein